MLAVNTTAFCPGALVCALSTGPICSSCWFHHVHSQLSPVLPLAVSQAIPTQKFSSVLLISFCHCRELLESSYYAEYTVIYLRSYFGLVFRLLQDDLLLVTIELFPKTGHNFGLRLLPYELQSSIVVLENSLHSENISWNLPYCSPFVIPANFTDKCYMQKSGMEPGSPHKSFPCSAFPAVSQLIQQFLPILPLPFLSSARHFSAVLCFVGCSSSPTSIALIVDSLNPTMDC